MINWWQWIVQTNDVTKLWAAQPTYIISQSVYLLAGMITLIHAFCKGGRWPYFWLGTILHGLFSDNFWHFIMPEYDNFWHSQTPVMFMGGRLPMHIIFLYPAFMYHAAYAVSKLKLPKYAEPFAFGLLVVLIDIPYDIVAVKFVHWTWHDTDPNIYDRHYWVPWNSYYFHATFAASFYFFFHWSRRFLEPYVAAQWQTGKTLSEWKSVMIASLLGMPGGVLLFVPIYHPLHDVFGIHSEVTFFLLFAIYGMITLYGLLSAPEDSEQIFRLTKIDYVLIIQLALHYCIYLMFVVFFDPEKESSLGLHEPIGPCNIKDSLVTPFGQKLYKQKYLCPENYDESYFDFHCVDEIPPNGSTWYQICGTPFENRVEYVVVLSTILFVAFGVFHIIYFKKNKMVDKVQKLKAKKHK